MEIIATKDETSQLVQKNKSAAFLIFPEDRLNSIRMTKDLPQRWIESEQKNSWSGEASRGENFSFQLGLFALQNLEAVKVNFTNLTSSSGKIISSENIFCINTGGIGYDGMPFTKTLHVDSGKVQALWCGINVPENTAPASYSGKVTISAKGQPAKEIQLSLAVTASLIKDGGVNEPWKMTRLRWLNSTLAQENTVIAPYSPLVVKGNVIKLSGRKLIISPDGFPRQIQTFFTPEMTAVGNKANDIIVKPFQLIAEDAHGQIQWKSNPVKFISKTPGTVKWEALSSSSSLHMQVNASMEFDGFVSYTVKISAENDIDLKDIRLEIPMAASSSKYMMGLGQKGGYRPENFEWKWDVAHKNQDGAWIGNVNAGLQFSLRDERYLRPLNTNFYLLKPLLLPTSWGNEGKGGIKIIQNNKTTTVQSYSGERRMKKGDVLYYNFTLLITPFHIINTDFQWATRFYHAYKPIDTIQATGGYSYQHPSCNRNQSLY